MGQFRRANCGLQARRCSGKSSTRTFVTRLQSSGRSGASLIASTSFLESACSIAALSKVLPVPNNSTGSLKRSSVIWHLRRSGTSRAASSRRREVHRRAAVAS